MSNLNFSINGKSINQTLYIGKARQFEIHVDEPQALSGNDSAPNPVEYILAGYAGCLNVVFHLVANELKIIISELKININGDINPNKFLGINAEERAGFKNLTVNITIQTNATREEEERLFEQVKQRCPVNDNLINPTPVFYKINKAFHLN